MLPLLLLLLFQPYGECHPGALGKARWKGGSFTLSGGSSLTCWSSSSTSVGSVSVGPEASFVLLVELVLGLGLGGGGGAQRLLAVVLALALALAREEPWTNSGDVARLSWGLL